MLVWMDAYGGMRAVRSAMRKSIIESMLLTKTVMTSTMAMRMTTPRAAATRVGRRSPVSKSCTPRRIASYTICWIEETEWEKQQHQNIDTAEAGRAVSTAASAHTLMVQFTREDCYHNRYLHHERASEARAYRCEALCVLQADSSISLRHFECIVLIVETRQIGARLAHPDI